LKGVFVVRIVGNAKVKNAAVWGGEGGGWLWAMVRRNSQKKIQPPRKKSFRRGDQSWKGN